MYRVFKQLGNGELLDVAHCYELGEAAQLIAGLNAHWPGEYVVQDSEGNDVDLSG